MDQGPVGAVEECFSVGAEEMVAHSEEVVTSSEVVAPTNQPQPTAPVYNIPTIIASPGPIMQVVTLQPASSQVGLTNTLRNIRLIAIQPKLPFNGTNGRAQPISLGPKATDIKIQPQPSEAASKKVAVNSFYSKPNNQPVTLAPKQQQQHVVKPSPSYYKEQQREREMKEFSHLNEELQRGLRILLDLTTSLHHNTTWPFMERVDPLKDGAPDYDQVIKKPMWLTLVKDKFRQNQYSSIGEFVSDMRLILENCYRYNGPNHPITKKALRLEQSLEQKLALLPSDLRTKCAIVEAESERKSRPSESYFSVLLHRVRHEREEREQMAKEKRAEEQRLRREEKERQRCVWAERMMNPQVKSQMRTMWEIPQIGHFLHLARGALHIGEIAQYELEHMFLMPEASALLATLMTSLLSSPNQRVKLAESPPTPYAVWSLRINSRVAEWYRTYNREARQFVKLHELLGIEPLFWRVCGDTNPLEGGGKLYHQLSFLKRVWIFKGLCDSVAHSHKTVQEAMAEEEGPESRQVTLGQDANGYTYLHFPAVSGSDIRVYRQKAWDLEADPIWGPIAAERRQAEEQRVREEELKAAELRKRKRTSVASKRTTTTPTKRTRKKQQPARTTPQRKRSAPEERPSRIGTRVSPRTLQRQTGLTLYKDTSSEDESEEEESEEEEEESVSSEDSDEPGEEVAVPVQRKRRGRRPRSRKRPVKKKLQKIVEESENVNNVEEKGEKKLEEEMICEQVNDETKTIEEKLNNETIKDDVKEEKTTVEENVKEEEVVDESLPNGDIFENEEKIDKVKIKEETDQQQVKEEEKENLVKMETVDEVSTPSSQRFTVSQLLQKLTPDEKQPAPTEVAAAQVESDPERTSYDPYFFELIISSVEELQEWINRFTDSKEELEDQRKLRPRCEIKLRERLQSLLDEAQPLAIDQQQANQKICQQLWKEWERYRCSSSSVAAVEDSGHSESDTEQEDDDDGGGSSSGGEDGVRHSRRLRVKRIRTNGSHQSTRSSSPQQQLEEDQPATKQNRKSSYHFDPEWESDPSTTPEVPGRSKHRSSFVPEMKNPDYWIGRRVTRATAAFVDVDQPAAEEQKQQPTTTPSSVQSDQLMNQLRQLRRQQALLSSNDPRPGGSNGGGSPAVYFPSKDGQYLRITNPKAAELLSKLRMTRPPPQQPSKIFIQQRPPPGIVPIAPKSIDITNLISQAAQKGLIVAHEPRRLSMDMGEHGLYMVTAQLTPTGPKVISATPLARKPKIITTTTESVPVPPADVPVPATSPVAVPTTTTNGGGSPPPVVLKQVTINDPRQNNIISADVLRSVAGPEAVGAKLTIVKEGNTKMLTLILSNGEIRRLTTSQVQQIQAAVRNQTTTKNNETSS